eukprot:scaffold29358_cov154-Skeletonema_menzelii.AAC.2
MTCMTNDANVMGGGVAVFQLPEGKMLSFFGLVPRGSALDIPNGVLGVLFYIYVFIRCNVRDSKLILLDSRVNAVICTLAMASSLFLARKLYMIKEICVGCFGSDAEEKG